MFLRLAQRHLPKGADPEDCLQDATVLALRSFGQFRGEAKLSTWFGTIVRNCALGRFRRLRNEISLDECQERRGRHGIPIAVLLPSACFTPDVLDTDDRIDREQILSRLFSLINAMPCGYRSIFQLRYVEGLALQEIGELLEIPVGTVKARLSRGKVILRARLKVDA